MRTSNDWISVKTAAKLLGISERRVQALVKQKRLKATRIGERMLMLRRADVMTFSKIDRPTGRPKRRAKSKSSNKKGK